MPIFIIAVVLAVLAVAGTFTVIPFITANSFWVSIVAFIVLAIGNLAKGL
jgi:hypothetical protein